jgi:hypothetical protein
VSLANDACGREARAKYEPDHDSVAGAGSVDHRVSSRWRPPLMALDRPASGWGRGGHFPASRASAKYYNVCASAATNWDRRRYLLIGGVKHACGRAARETFRLPIGAANEIQHRIADTEPEALVRRRQRSCAGRASTRRLTSDRGGSATAARCRVSHAFGDQTSRRETVLDRAST